MSAASERPGRERRQEEPHRRDLADGQQHRCDQPEHPGVHALESTECGGSGQERAREVLRVERPQVLELLADPDQLDRDPELVGDRQRDAALGRAVELGEDDAGDVDGLAEQLGLADAVLARGGVDGHQRLVRRVGHLLGDDAADLGQLGHQVGLGVQAAGGVDDHDVDALLAAAGDGVERDGAGVRALGAAHELAAGALGPALELLDGGGAEGVGGGDQDALAERLLQVPGELADRRRLAGAVDADDEDHGRVGAQVDVVVAGLGEVGEELRQPLGQRLAAGDLALLGLPLEPLDDLRGRARADVGVDQRLLQALPGLLVEVALEQRGLDLGLQRLARLAHVLAHAAEEAAALLLALGLLDRRGRAVARDEEVVPVSGHGSGENRAMIEFRREPAGSPAARTLLTAMEQEMFDALRDGGDADAREHRGPRAARRRRLRGRLGGRAGGRGRRAQAARARRGRDQADVRGAGRAPAAGIARRLLAALEDAARELGYERVRLDTGARQPHARALYESAGFQPIPDYNDNPKAAYWGEKVL